MFLEYEYLFHDCQVQQRSNKQTNKRTKIHETRINAGRSYLIEPTCKKLQEEIEHRNMIKINLIIL